MMSDISQRFIIEWFCSYRPTLLHQPSALQKWRNLYQRREQEFHLRMFGWIYWSEMRECGLL